MAKLSAHGRRALAEASIELETPDGELTIWSRQTVRVMSDGKLLEKRDVRFKPDAQSWKGEEKGRYHSYGWKVLGQYVPASYTDDAMREKFMAAYQEKNEGRKAKGRTALWAITRL